jgi:hypothetical protein
MKKLLVIAVVFVSVCSYTVKAEEIKKANPRVEQAFANEFKGAQYVKWELIRKENIYQVHFIYNNERLDAFFDADGTLIGTGRFIAVSNLPLLVSKNVNEQYSGYQVREAVEYIKGNETSYLVTVENEKATLIVHVFNGGSSYVFKKEKKNSLAKL